LAQRSASFALWGEHEGITHSLDLKAFMESFLAPHNGIMFSEQLYPPGITKTFVEGRRVLNIREEDRDSAVRRRVRG
jgi:hypothetical protein